MNLYRIREKWAAGLLFATLAVAVAAPAAEARHGGWRRYKDCDTRVVRRVCQPARVIEVRSSSCGLPALAGFIGGFALGTAFSSAPEPSYHHYYYYDPYCDERFASLEIYRTHLRDCRHPRIVRVIDVDTGDCVHTYRYRHGGWVDCDEDWDDD
jgi:hypothetical protein